MVAGPSLDRHHWMPRAEGGRDRAWVHVVCHRMIHRLFSDGDLAGPLADPAALRAHPAMQKFIAWVRRKPADYVDWPRTARNGRAGRRR